MNKYLHLPKKPYLLGLALVVLLNACSSAPDAQPAKPPRAPTSGEVILDANSPKKAYVKVAALALEQHPLLQPLAGKIVYDESLTSRISSPVAGRVINTPLALGSPVQPGTTLLELSSPDVADAEAAYIKADADLVLANNILQRQQQLYEGKAIALKDLELAQDGYHTAQSELQRALNRLKNLHINPHQSDGRFALRANLPGIVVERSVNPGMEVRPDLDTPLFVISDIKKLTVLMEVYEVNIGKIKPGQKLSVTVPAYPDQEFAATVRYIGQVLDENTRTVQVRCDLPNSDGRLLPGMYATITIKSAPDDQAILIPLTAIFTEDDADYVFVEIAENHYKQRAVEIGLRLKDKAVISSGLQPNERLVTEGALMLRTEEEVETDVKTAQ
ncbi:efflux RND transporter periplasmic adaptor subunit [Methylomonas paludis]|uniref:Efflux RND transporter periplasmic adaptor subunit n=1 Tax=Methylomonas paludis TaxID=1173101 RepID=A0A975MN50_9GAMM|nr:efflux RND transporter periplasmic adaptor subunit [Methylomonas paludis]QWF70842.1 efflux RND transporter periplasmic adaptor subunit [Methylomonas paludis]